MYQNYYGTFASRDEYESLYRVGTFAASGTERLTCARCGDIQVSPGAWYGAGDIIAYTAEDEPVAQEGGLGSCGDLHSWE